MNEKPGPSEDYPRGKLNPQDKGGLRVGIATDEENQVIRIEFGTPCTWLALDKDSAINFAMGILKRAEKLK